jgi:hypothetical protein
MKNIFNNLFNPFRVDKNKEIVYIILLDTFSVPLRIVIIINLILLTSFLPAQILLNEFMIDPENDNTGEYIEIYNAGDTVIDLSLYYICDAQDTDKIIPFPDALLYPGQYGLLLDPDYSGEYDHLLPDSIPCFSIPDSRFGMYGISNSTHKPFSILSQELEIIDIYITGSPVWPDATFSIERDRFQDTLWSMSSDPFGTPGFRNSSSPKDHDLSISDLCLNVVDNILSIELSINNIGLKEISQFNYGYIVDISNYQTHLNDTIIVHLDTLVKAGASLLFHTVHELNFRGAFTLTAYIEYPDNCRDTTRSSGFAPIRENELIITEFVSQTGDDFSCEYIELLSRSKYPIQVMELEIYDMTGSTRVLSDYILMPDSMFVLAQSASFHDDFPSVSNYIIPPAWRSLNNSEDDIRLLNHSGSPICNLHYNAVWDILPDCAMQLVDTALNYRDPLNWESSQHGSPGSYNKTEKQLFHLSCQSESMFFTPNDTLKFFVINDGYFPLDAQSITFSTPLSEQNFLIPKSFPGDTLICFPDTTNLFHEGTQLCSLYCDPYFTFMIKFYSPLTKTPCYFNEVLFDPLYTYGQSEFIELHCPSTQVDLDHWKLCVNNSSISLLGSLQNTYTLLCDYDEAPDNLAESSMLMFSNFPNLPNSGSEITLLDPMGRIMDFCNLREHPDIQEGKSLEKQFLSILSSDPTLWSSSVSKDGMTPARLNSITSLPGFYDDLDIYPEVFDPQQDEHIQFSIDSELSLQYSELFCFNLAGQTIYHSEQALFSNPSYVHFWNGKMENGDYPSRGLYFALVILHNLDGKTRKLKGTFAVK